MRFVSIDRLGFIKNDGRRNIFQCPRLPSIKPFRSPAQLPTEAIPLIASLRRQSRMLMLILVLQQTAAACQYTVRDVAMVDLNEKKYVLCLITENPLSPSQVESLSSVVHSLDDSNVAFRLLESSREPVGPAESSILSALESLDITSYPAAVLLAPDGRTLSLPLNKDELFPGNNAIDVAAVRQFLQSAITSPPREELLQYLLRGHSAILVVEGTDNTNNGRAVIWAEAALARVENALPTMAKPIELPPRLFRFSPEQAQSEKVLLWSLGIDFSQESTAHIALLFGRGRKLGPVLQIPGSLQEDLWRSLEVVGSDCECGLDRSWMQDPMIPHLWSPTNETNAVAALGFDPGNPLVKAEISRILARSSLAPEHTKQSLQQPLEPQLRLGEIDIDALVSEQLEAKPSQPSSQTTSESVKPPNTRLPQAKEDSPKIPETSRSVFAWVIAALLLVAGLGSLGILLIGRKKQV